MYSFVSALLKAWRNSRHINQDKNHTSTMLQTRTTAAASSTTWFEPQIHGMVALAAAAAGPPEVTGPTKVAVTAATTTRVPGTLGVNQTREKHPLGGSLEQGRESLLGRTGQTRETPSERSNCGWTQPDGRTRKATTATNRLGRGSTGMRQETSLDRQITKIR